MRLCRQTRFGLAVAAAMLVAGGAASAWAVEYANLEVTDGATPHIDAPTVTIANGTADFHVDPGAVVGEYPIRIGASASDDAAGGVLISGVTEFGITNSSTLLDETLYATTSVVADDDPTSTNTRNASGGLAIVTDRGGNNVVAGSNYLLGAPINADVNAAYFPFSEGWKGGSADGTLNGATVDRNFFVQTVGDVGDHRVTIAGVQDTRRQGLLFSTAAINDNDHSVVSYSADGTSFNVTTRGNAQNGGDAQDDRPSFVFVPLGTPNLTMGSIFGQTGQNAQPHTLLGSGSAFTVVKEEVAVGEDTSVQFRLSITGESPTSGTLIVQSSGNLDGDSGLAADNLLTYVPDGNEWIITSDDLPNANGLGQRGDTGERQPHFQFMFMPFDAKPTAPGPLPALNWDRSSVIAFNAEVHEIDGTDNNNDDGTVGQYVTAPTGTQGIEFFGLRTNKGDNSVSADSVLPVGSEGVMFATISEGLRDNSATGGAFEYAVAATSTTGDSQSWEVHTSVAAPTNGEHNINFSAVLFGSESGFQMEAEHPITLDGKAEITLTGVDSQADGVLMANPHGNEDNFVTITPMADGSGWQLEHFDNSGGQEGPTGDETDSVNWIYLPYDTENLVAGRVNADGSLINSTDTGEFTLTKGADGEYLLTVNGRTPDQGMLLLNALGDDALPGSDNMMVYETSGSSFKILNLDSITGAESDLGMLVEPEDAGFQFAFIDFVTPPELPGGDLLAADFDEDGDVDGNDLTVWKGAFGSGAGADADGDGDSDGADFLAWQRQVGMSSAAPAAGAVPEPGALALAALAGLGLVAAARRKV